MKKDTSGLDPQTRALVQKLAADYSNRMAQGEKIGLGGILQELVNSLMEQDRGNFLTATGDTANGFYERTLPLSMAKLDLKVPRVRFGTNAFRPAILPARWKRVGKEYEELLIALLSNNYSHSQIKRACQQLGLPFSQDALNDALALIEERLQVFKTQLFNASWFAIYIDAYHAKLRAEDGRVTETVIYVAVGLNMEAEKHILGYWVCKGRESKAFWTEVFQELITRGVSRVLLFATDNFPGVSDVIKRLYPYSDHQLCFVHMMRNVSRALSKKNSAQALQLLKLVKTSRDEAEGGMYYDQLCALMEPEKPEMAALYRRCRSNYLAFLKYPLGARKYIYTTNVVESINSGIERMRINLGGYFPSQRALDVNLFIQMVNLQDHWEKKGVPGIRECLYEIRQMFALRFEISEN